MLSKVASRSRESGCPPYWSEACDALVRFDPILRPIIEKYSDLFLVSNVDAFSTIVHAIIGQQISISAAEKIWERFCKFCISITPQKLFFYKLEELKAIGLSSKKASYILGAAEYFLNHPGMVKSWSEMSDYSVIKHLTKIKGIGVWTADMFLIFHLLRPDVAPLSDVGLARAMDMQYGGGVFLTSSQKARIVAGWRPWSTVATWYLWCSLDSFPVFY